MPRPGRADGRTCLIVGGTSGIGLSFARAFSRGSCACRRGGASAEADRSELDQLSLLGPCRELTIELTLGESEVARLFGFAMPCWAVDWMFSCTSPGSAAGSWAMGLSMSVLTEGWDHVMRINALGVFLTNRAAVGIMRSQSVDVPVSAARSSTWDRPSPSPAYFATVAYAASKGAGACADAGFGGSLCTRAGPLQHARARSHRHADGRPSHNRSTNSGLFAGEAANGERSRIGRRRRRGRTLSM